MKANGTAFAEANGNYNYKNNEMLLCIFETRKCYCELLEKNTELLEQGNTLEKLN